MNKNILFTFFSTIFLFPAAHAMEENQVGLVNAPMEIHENIARHALMLCSSTTELKTTISSLKRINKYFCQLMGGQYTKLNANGALVINNSDEEIYLSFSQELIDIIKAQYKKITGSTITPLQVASLLKTRGAALYIAKNIKKIKQEYDTLIFNSLDSSDRELLNDFSIIKLSEENLANKLMHALEANDSYRALFFLCAGADTSKRHIQSKGRSARAPGKKQGNHSSPDVVQSFLGLK